MNRRTTALATFILVAPAGAAHGDQLYDELLVCRSLPAEDARVICYDAAIDRSRQRSSTRQAPAVEPTPAVPAPDATVAAGATAPEAISQENLFGKSGDEVQRSVEEATGNEPLDSLSAEVSKIQQAGYDKIYITLDNGQVWQQIDSSRLRLRVGDTVRIERAALGSFKLKKEGSNRTMRVSRRD